MINSIPLNNLLILKEILKSIIYHIHTHMHAMHKHTKPSIKINGEAMEINFPVRKDSLPGKIRALAYAWILSSSMKGNRQLSQQYQACLVQSKIFTKATWLLIASIIVKVLTGIFINSTDSAEMIDDDNRRHRNWLRE